MATDWSTWYNNTLDALVSVIEGSTVNWATDTQGNPFVIVGDRETTGLEYPAAFIPSFSKSRNSSESDGRNEMHEIDATLLVLQQGDIKKPEANLREALDIVSKVENAIYDNRSLNGTCNRATVTGSTPFAGVGQDANLEGGEIEISILKEADHYA